MMSLGVMSGETSTPFSSAMRARLADVNIGTPPPIRAGQHILCLGRQRRSNASSLAGRGHLRLELGKKFVHYAVTLPCSDVGWQR